MSNIRLLHGDSYKLIKDIPDKSVDLVYIDILDCENFLKAQEDPSILHYAGNEKPWKFPNMQYAEIFWSYFRNTPYYEEFLYETFKGIDTSPNELSIRIDNLERNLKSRKFLLKWIIGEGRFGKFVRKIWRKLRRR